MSSLITSGVSFRLPLSFQYTNMKTFLRNYVGENVESRTEKNVSDQKKKYCPLEINENCYLDPS